MLLCLYWRRTTLQGAVAGMVVGAATVILWNTFLSPLGGWFGVYELLPGFVLATIAIVAVSLLTKEPDAAVLEEFDTYMDLEV
jgi:sodium/proline symporter